MKKASDGRKLFQVLPIFSLNGKTAVRPRPPVLKYQILLLHITGLAFDFYISGPTPKDLCVLRNHVCPQEIFGLLNKKKTISRDNTIDHLSWKTTYSRQKFLYLYVAKPVTGKRYLSWGPQFQVWSKSLRFRQIWYSHIMVQFAPQQFLDIYNKSGAMTLTTIVFSMLKISFRLKIFLETGKQAETHWHKQVYVSSGFTPPPPLSLPCKTLEVNRGANFFSVPYMTNSCHCRYPTLVQFPVFHRMQSLSWLQNCWLAGGLPVHRLLGTFSDSCSDTRCLHSTRRDCCPRSHEVLHGPQSLTSQLKSTRRMQLWCRDNSKWADINENM